MRGDPSQFDDVSYSANEKKIIGHSQYLDSEGRTPQGSFVQRFGSVNEDDIK
jgi:hypothetical protein